MFNGKINIIILSAAALLQLYVPASMILERESILKNGKQYKFKAAPVDPNDPFRGKYITLQYDARIAKVNDKLNWQNEGEEPVFVIIDIDKDGYAKIDTILKEKPSGTKDYIKAKVDYVSYDSLVYIDYPFSRYYMEEQKAPRAEKLYIQSTRDTSHKTYSLVCIKNGEAVLKDVLIDEIPIGQITKEKN